MLKQINKLTNKYFFKYKLLPFRVSFRYKTISLFMTYLVIALPYEVRSRRMLYRLDIPAGYDKHFNSIENIKKFLHKPMSEVLNDNNVTPHVHSRFIKWVLNFLKNG